MHGRRIVGWLLLGLLAGISEAQQIAFNRSGNILISDQSNNRVIEVDPTSHQVVWQFGDGSAVPGPHSVVGPKEAERVGNLTLIAGGGALAGSQESCPEGCSDNRVMLVDQSGNILWEYGEAGLSGFTNNRLNFPVHAALLPNQHVLITDMFNDRVIEVTMGKKLVWQYGTSGLPGSGFNQLNEPGSAELLANGNILIGDGLNNRVIEVNRTSKRIVWQYGTISDTSILNGVSFASRLPSGNTLITDEGNNRVLEVTPTKKIVFQYNTNMRPGSTFFDLPTRAVRLKSGNTLICDQFNDQVIAIGATGTLPFSQGVLGLPGNSFNRLNAPYDAKVIGDFTGLTPPF